MIAILHSVAGGARHCAADEYRMSATDWEPTVRLSSGSLPAYKSFPCQSSLAVGTGGSLHAVWYEARAEEKNSLVYYRRSTTSGKTWEEAQILSSSGYLDGWTDSANPSVAVRGSQVHVFWQDGRDGNGEVYYRRSLDDGVTWLEEERLTAAQGKSVQPAAALSGSTVHLLWGDYRDSLPGPEVEVYYKRSGNSGATWSDDVRLTWSLLAKGMPTVACADSNVLVFWMDHRGDNWEIYYKRSKDGGTTWSPDTRFTENTGVSEVPVVAVEGNIVHVAWAENTLPDGKAGTVDDYEERYARSTDGGATWSEAAVLTNAPKLSADPSIAVVDNVVHLAWADRREGKEKDPRALDRGIYYKSSTDGGVSWSSDLCLTSDSSHTNIPFIAASTSAVHVMWLGDLDTIPQVFYRRNSSSSPDSPRAPHILAQNYPNPFNPATLIPYEIGGMGGSEVNASIAIYDLRGRHVRTLIDGIIPQGAHEVYWDGLDGSGVPVHSGVYLFRLRAGGVTHTRRMLLLR